MKREFSHDKDTLLVTAGRDKPKLWNFGLLQMVKHLLERVVRFRTSLNPQLKSLLEKQATLDELLQAVVDEYLLNGQDNGESPPQNPYCEKCVAGLLLYP